MTAAPLSWDSLPPHVIVKAFSYLSDIKDLHHACLTCRSFHTAFLDPSIWREIGLTFIAGDSAEKILRVIPQFGVHFRDITVNIDQEDEANRQLALRALNDLHGLPDSQYETLTVRFVGTNPLFYGGQEFTDGIKSFLAGINQNSLRKLDLSGFYGKISDDLLDALVRAHSESLKEINIQNKQLVCQVSPESVATMVDRCRGLTDLQIYCCSMSDRMIRSFMEQGRAKINHLSIYCSAQDKFNDDYDVPNATWTEFRDRLPHARVTVIIDPRCFPPRILDIMQPSMPIGRYHLITERIPRAELEYLASNFSETLRHVYMNTASSTKFQEVLVTFFQSIGPLESLHLKTKTTRGTVDAILAAQPVLKENGQYTMMVIPDENIQDDLIPFIETTGHA